MERNQLLDITINKRTELGKKLEEQSKIRTIVSRIVYTMHNIEEKIGDDVENPVYAFRLPDWETEWYLTMYVDCSPEACKLIIDVLKALYPNVCSFKQTNLK